MQSSLRARVWTQRLTRIVLYGFVVVLLLRRWLTRRSIDTGRRSSFGRSR